MGESLFPLFFKPQFSQVPTFFREFPQFHRIKWHKYAAYFIAFFKKTCRIIKDFWPHKSQKNAAFFWRDCLIVGPHPPTIRLHLLQLRGWPTPRQHQPWLDPFRVSPQVLFTNRQNQYNQKVRLTCTVSPHSYFT